jgi:hypothetical protein
MPEVRGAVVAALAEVLARYAEPYDAQRPKVNFAETSRQWSADRPPPLAASPPHRQRADHADERPGPRKLLIFCEPQAGWRHGTVTERRTKPDFAPQLQWLVDERYPQAEGMRVILDHLNPQGPGSLSEVFEPAAARRLGEKGECHYPPKPGSWLNRAAIDLSLLQRQCLKRPIATEERLKREVAAWEHRRKATPETLDWRFTLTAAREKLNRRYPTNSLR